MLGHKSSMKNYFKANYLDASAIIKILVDEDGSSEIQKYFRTGGSNFYMTSLCFSEALGVLKVKYFIIIKLQKRDILIGQTS